MPGCVAELVFSIFSWAVASGADEIRSVFCGPADGRECAAVEKWWCWRCVSQLLTVRNQPALVDDNLVAWSSRGLPLAWNPVQSYNTTGPEMVRTFLSACGISLPSAKGGRQGIVLISFPQVFFNA